MKKENEETEIKPRGKKFIIQTGNKETILCLREIPRFIRNEIFEKFQQEEIKHQTLPQGIWSNIEDSIAEILLIEAFEQAPEPAIFQFDRRFSLKIEGETLDFPGEESLVDYICENLLQEFQADEIFCHVTDLPTIQQAVETRSRDHSVVSKMFDREYS